MLDAMKEWTAREQDAHQFRAQGSYRDRSFRFPVELNMEWSRCTRGRLGKEWSPTHTISIWNVQNRQFNAKMEIYCRIGRWVTGQGRVVEGVAKGGG